MNTGYKQFSWSMTVLELTRCLCYRWYKVNRADSETFINPRGKLFSILNESKTDWTVSFAQLLNKLKLIRNSGDELAAHMQNIFCFIIVLETHWISQMSCSRFILWSVWSWKHYPASVLGIWEFLLFSVHFHINTFSDLLNLALSHKVTDLRQKFSRGLAAKRKEKHYNFSASFTQVLRTLSSIIHWFYFVFQRVRI